MTRRQLVNTLVAHRDRCAPGSTCDLLTEFTEGCEWDMVNDTDDTAVDPCDESYWVERAAMNCEVYDEVLVRALER